jgi:hypothetical protein
MKHLITAQYGEFDGVANLASEQSMDTFFIVGASVAAVDQGDLVAGS